MEHNFDTCSLLNNEAIQQGNIVPSKEEGESFPHARRTRSKGAATLFTFTNYTSLNFCSREIRKRKFLLSRLTSQFCPNSQCAVYILFFLSFKCQTINRYAKLATNWFAGVFTHRKVHAAGIHMVLLKSKGS